jgi:hypothetical protein
MNCKFQEGDASNLHEASSIPATSLPVTAALN